MKFLDRAKIHVKSGAGGAGCLSFRREKFVEFGGPDGGNGGRGGHVFAEAVNNLNTLIDYKYQQHFKAVTGLHGAGRHRSGAAGKDLILKVPVGTQIFEEDEKTLVADLSREGQRALLARGGNGGFGNAQFKSSRNQAPRRANPGQAAESRSLWLRLKLIADIGLIGLPNAGKSTFLSVVSAAKPKIADYPFTTLYPNLGVVRRGAGRSFVLADIPGLIEGAHQGAGIGDRFLGHVERCAALLHLVDGTLVDIVENYTIIRRELAAYSSDLAARQEIIALTKTDALAPDVAQTQKRALEQHSGATVMPISSVTHDGVPGLLSLLEAICCEGREISRQPADSLVPDSV